MGKIGITTTVPVEVLIAKGYEVVDLNNIFITDKNYGHFIEIAEEEGFKRSFCAFKKGVYGAAMENGFKNIVGVTEGDCSNTKALLNVFKLKGVKIYSFAYPVSHKLSDVKKSLDDFMAEFNVPFTKVEKVRRELNEVRALVRRLDELTYLDNKATALENHIYQISCSDFNGDFRKFKLDLVKKIDEIEKRKPINAKIRLGFIGTPPVLLDIYDYVEKFNARFVYNEVQREFAFPRADKCKNIYEQYYDYTYPYSLDFRLNEIEKQIKERKIDAIINYTQAFCYRNAEHIVIKEKLNVPVLNVEGDKANCLDSRTKLRIEAFLDMILDLKETKN